MVGNRAKARSAFALLFLLTTYAQAQQPYPPPPDHPSPAWFVDVAAKAGILVRNVNGSDEAKRYIIGLFESALASGRA